MVDIKFLTVLLLIFTSGLTAKEGTRRIQKRQFLQAFSEGSGLSNYDCSDTDGCNSVMTPNFKSSEGKNSTSKVEKTVASTQNAVNPYAFFPGFYGSYPYQYTYRPPYTPYVYSAFPYWPLPLYGRKKRQVPQVEDAELTQKSKEPINSNQSSGLTQFQGHPPMIIQPQFAYPFGLYPYFFNQFPAFPAPPPGSPVVYQNFGPDNSTPVVNIG